MPKKTSQSLTAKSIQITGGKPRHKSIHSQHRKSWRNLTKNKNHIKLLRREASLTAVDYLRTDVEFHPKMAMKIPSQAVFQMEAAPWRQCLSKIVRQ